MPNFAFHYEALKQVAQQRAANGDALAKGLQKNNFNNALMPFAVLGALGPDIFRYMPVSGDLAAALLKVVNDQANANANLQAILSNKTLSGELYFNPFGAVYSILFNALVVPFWPLFNQFNAVLSEMATAVQNQDATALGNATQSLKSLQDANTQLDGLAKSTLPGLLKLLAFINAEAAPWMELNQTAPAPADPIMLRRYEFLRWYNTGRFAQNLVGQADNQTKQAYAFGWQCHIAGSVTSEPFINNIVGGPYRTHWWRNRLAGNFVDAWTYGFFEQSPQPAMTGTNGDTPDPFYADPATGAAIWPDITAANLQNLFNVAGLAGPATVDDVPDAVKAMAANGGNGAVSIADLLQNFPFSTDITDLLSAAIQQTYTQLLGSTLNPLAKEPTSQGPGAPGPAFAAADFAETLGSAYIGAFAVYWFMTSGSGPMGSNSPGTNPDPSQPPPSWVSTPGSAPAPPTQTEGPSTGETVCGVLLAIFAVIELLTGGVIAGVAALVAAIALLESSTTTINWQQVAVNLYWLRKTFADLENALRDALVKGALAYPPPVSLGVQVLPNIPIAGIQGLTTPAQDLSGTNLCKTNSQSPDTGKRPGRYPRWLDTTFTDPNTNQATAIADLNFQKYPASVVTEAALANNLFAGGLYPNACFPNQNNTSANANIFTPPPAGQFTHASYFGDAVAVGVAIIGQGAVGLPDYNLDGDRGYGWIDWQPQKGTNPFTAQAVTPQPAP